MTNAPTLRLKHELGSNDGWRDHIVAVVGPTAVGKSAVAEEIAVRLSGEIVSADSMQVYRGMDIGTAKLPADQRRVPYHCVDLADPGEPFSAALYQAAARAAFADIWKRSALPVLVGGTGLYVRAAVDAMEFPPGEQEANPTRERYESYADANGAQALHDLLAARDLAASELIHPNNVRRVARALEMSDGGVSYADQHAGFSARTSVYRTVFIGLEMERRSLYERIEARVDAMIAEGLLDEVGRLLHNGLPGALTAPQGIGYKELVPVVEGQASLDEAVASIKQATRRYAKRQLTWFKADPRIRWVDVTQRSVNESADAAVAALDWSDS